MAEEKSPIRNETDIKAADESRRGFILLGRRKRKQAERPEDEATAGKQADVPESGDKNESEGGGIDPSIAAAVALGVALGASKEAEAGISMDAVGKAVANQMKGPLGELLQAFLGQIGQMMSGATSQVTAANATTGDAIITAMTKIQNKDVEKAAFPPPSACEGEKRAEKVSKAAKNTSEKVAGRDRAVVDTMMENRKPDALRKSRVKRHHNRFAYGKDKNKDLSAASSLAFDELPDKIDQKAAMEYVNHVLGDTMTSAVPPVDNIDKDQSSGAIRFKAKQMSYVARTSMAQKALDELVQSRIPQKEGEPSRLGAMEREVASTYGDPAWRASLEQHVDPTGPTKELVYQTAFGNYLLLEQYRQNETMIGLLATMLLNQLEDEDRIHAINKAARGVV